MGKSIFDHVVNRIRLSKIDPQIVLATSDNAADDPLALYAKYLGIKVVRGSQNDVVGRFAYTLKKFKCDAFFRVCGDSPLLLSSLFDIAASIYKRSNYDLISNVFPRTFPPGMSIELIKTKIFLNTVNNIIKKNEREHLTKYFYQNSKQFKILNIKCSKPKRSNLKLSLDELHDLKRLEVWYKNKGKNYEALFPIKNDYK